MSVNVMAITLNEAIKDLAHCAMFRISAGHVVIGKRCQSYTHESASYPVGA